MIYRFLSNLDKEEKKKLKTIPNHERIQYLKQNNNFSQNNELDIRISLSIEDSNFCDFDTF